MWKGYAAAQANRPPNRGPPSPTGTRPILTGSLTYGGNQQGLAQEPPPAQAFMGPKEQVPADVNGGNLIPRLGPTNLVQEQQQQPPRPFYHCPSQFERKVITTQVKIVFIAFHFAVFRVKIFFAM